MRELLPHFIHPSHYLGTEINAVHKRPESVRLRWGLAFPDLYEVAMSYPGLGILYHQLNSRQDIWAERVFVPDPEVAQVLRRYNSPLCSLESDTPLSRLDLLGCSLTHELCYTSLLFLLDHAGIPLRASRRSEAHPLVLGGGDAMYNPEPVAPFLDAVLVGDGESAVLEISDLFLLSRDESWSRGRLLRALAEIDGVYVPSLFGEAKSGRNSNEDLPAQRVERRIRAELSGEQYPARQIVPFGRAVHDRLNIEIARGCTRGCRFCLAGTTQRPVRERPVEQIRELLRRGLEETGYEDVSFLSLSSGDFSQLERLFTESFSLCMEKKASISLPSLRAGSVSPALMQLMASLKRTGVTLAPEAGSQRLREVINKGISEEDILEHTASHFRMGWRQVKLYFMIGLPTEDSSDLEAILDLCRKVEQTAPRGGKQISITASVSTFVPKPHTPFQWERQISLEESREKIAYLSRLFKKSKRINLRWHDPEMSWLEGVFSRGDRNLAPAVEEAYLRGDVLTSWSDYFSPGIWREVFSRLGLDPEAYLAGPEKEADLPWDHIDAGVSRSFLLRERERARREKPTADCRYAACHNCGVCNHLSEGSHLRSQSRSVSIQPVLNQHSPDQGRGEARTSQQEELSRKEAQLRLWFQKTGAGKYLSQLEMQSVLERAMRKAGIPLSFTQGYSPSPRISFPRALPVGVESLCEWFQVLLRHRCDPENIKEGINRNLPSGIRVFSLQEIPLQEKPRPLEEDTFRITYLGDRAETDSYVKAWQQALTAEEIPLQKQTKKGGQKVVNVREALQSVQSRGEGTVLAKCDWSRIYVNPLDLVQAVTPEVPADGYSICKISPSRG